MRIFGCRPIETKVEGALCIIKNKFKIGSTTTKVPRNAEVYIDLAYSERSAMLRAHNNSCFRHRISELFAQGAVDIAIEGRHAEELLPRDRNTRRRIKSAPTIHMGTIALRDSAKRDREEDPKNLDMEEEPRAKLARTESLAIASAEGGSGGSGASFDEQVGNAASSSASGSKNASDSSFKPTPPK